ncbi:MAG: hypothetical protein HQK62_01935 [Desulfamplus sp.]|nr:hypothetical protein [Desulfamplus sp.]
MPPGGEGKIQIKVDTKGYLGKTLSKIIKIYTNDTTNSVKELKISGTVETLVSISPNVVRLTGSVSQHIGMTVKIIPVEKYQFSVKSLQLSDGTNVSVQIRQSKIPVGSWELIVLNIRENAGRYFDSILLETDSSVQPEIKINVFGNITE